MKYENEFVTAVNLRFCAKSLPSRPCHSTRQATKAENIVSPILTQNLPSSKSLVHAISFPNHDCFEKQPQKAYCAY